MSSWFKITKHTRKQATISKIYQKQQMDQVTTNRNCCHHQTPQYKCSMFNMLKELKGS